MNNEENLNDPAYHLLIIVLGGFFKRELGGTTEASEALAEKIVDIMDS